MITNPNPKTNWSVGDIVYYEQAWTDSITNGVIQTVVQPTGGTPYARIHNTEHLGTVDVPFDRLFESHSTAMDALTKHHDKLHADYAAGIKTVEDLVRFAYENCIATCGGEYVDWEARAAYRDRAKDLLGIDFPC